MFKISSYISLKIKKILPLFIFFIFHYVGFSQDDFETWPLSFDVTDSGIAVAEETSIVNEGNSSAKVTVNTGSQASTDWRKNIRRF